MKNHLGNLNSKDYSFTLSYAQLQLPTEQLYMEKINSEIIGNHKDFHVCTSKM